LIIIFENYYKQIFKKTNTITKKTMLGPTGYNNFIFLIWKPSFPFFVILSGKKGDN